MSASNYFFSFATGVTFGLIAGYMAGSQKETLFNSRVAKELQNARDSLKDAAKKDYEDLKKEYNKKLNETLNEIRTKLDQGGKAAKAK